jgi:hypothetical protein
MPADCPANDNTYSPGSERPMHLYIFKSESKLDLRAFTDDAAGARLPPQFAPWKATGAVAPGKNFPYRISREQIEAAIKTSGFQLWRPKSKPDGDAN